jgi:hypothetical protein
MEDRLDHSVFTRVVRNDGQHSPDCERVYRRIQPVRQLLFFLIDSNAKCLEHARGHVATPPCRHRHRSFHGLRQLARRAGLARQN